MSQFSSLPGFRDVYPEQCAARTHMMSAWREAARRFGFVEYDGPPLEALDLYVEKSGSEIVGQLYHFVDRGGRAVALRPEMTPTLARMVGSRGKSMRMPVRWFSIPQLFRYERTQRGRLREHWQWNVDVVGEAGIAADAEVLAVALEGLRILGLNEDDVVARINDRRLLELLLLHVGVERPRLGAAYAAIDKLGRDDEATIRARLREDAGIGARAIDDLFRIFECGSVEAIDKEYAGVPGIQPEIERLADYLRHLKDLGLADFVVFDPRIVRGLAYYTGLVFEIFDRRGEFRAICGGGRYDDLLGAIGGLQLPALGFGMGDVVLGEILQEHGLLPQQPQRVDYYILTISEAERDEVRRLAQALRAAGHSVIYSLKAASVARQIKEADARGAAFVVVLGPAELSEGMVILRDMQTGVERKVRLEELVR